jgi:glyoxylase I family protein
MIQGLDHIAIIISNEDNLEFYKKFGFVESRRFTRAYDTVVFMECTGNTTNSSVVLEIFIDKNHPARVSDPEAIGLRHIAFTVTDLDEMAKLIDCEPIRTDWFGRRFTFTKDPDGQSIELKEVYNN